MGRQNPRGAVFSELCMSLTAMARSFEVLMKPTLQLFRNFIECFLMLGWHLTRHLKLVEFV